MSYAIDAAKYGYLVQQSENVANILREYHGEEPVHTLPVEEEPGATPEYIDCVKKATAFVKDRTKENFMWSPEVSAQLRSRPVLNIDVWKCGKEALSLQAE